MANGEGRCEPRTVNDKNRADQDVDKISTECYNGLVNKQGILNRLAEIDRLENESSAWLEQHGSEIVGWAKGTGSYRALEDESGVDFGLLCNIANHKRPMTISVARMLYRFLTKGMKKNGATVYSED